MAQTPFFEDTIPTSADLGQCLKIEHYVPINNDWFVVVSDVKNSTKAIEAGQYRDINAIGGSTIAAVLNATRPRKIPYVFGGDGASFCVPPECLEGVKQALRGCQEFAEQTSGLFLRVGIVAIHDLSQSVLVSRFYRSEQLLQYFFMGGGLEQADQIIKDSNQFELDKNTPSKADFSGFECRWNEVPSQQAITFSLIVKATSDNIQQTLQFYQALTEKISALMGQEQNRPLSVKGLSLSFDSKKLKLEAASKTQGQAPWRQALQRWLIKLQNIIGIFWMRFNSEYQGYQWGNYKSDLIENSDYEKIDDAYRTVLSSNQAQLDELIAWLDKAYQAGQIVYGCHQTHAAVITCLVEQTGTQHIHFVDSTDGGYAMAAKAMKQQLKTKPAHH